MTSLEGSVAVEPVETTDGGDAPLTSSVRDALSAFANTDATAAELAVYILGRHSHYGSERAEEKVKGLDRLGSTDPKAERLPAPKWVQRISALFEGGGMISGRCVVLGLAILDGGVRRELLADGFLEVLSTEPQEGGHPSVETLLTPGARATLDEMLSRTGASGSTDTLSDAPATEDQLGRKAFAEVLAQRIRRLRDVEGGSPLVIHLDGPWGSGKSTVLNFLDSALSSKQSPSGGGWLVLRYNAWQYQRIDAPWWALTTLIAVSGGRQLFAEGAWLRSLRLALRHFWFRTFAGRVPILLAAFTAMGVGLLFLLNFSRTTSSLTQLKDTLSVATIVFGAVLAGSRFLTAADASAQEFLRSRPDPLGALVRHVGRLLNLLGRPVAILVDDIDRCDAVAVVRLLEGIHTVFGTIPIVFVTAGDGRWISRAFEKTYAEIVPQSLSSSSGRPLGALFLEKIFQFSAQVPDMPSALRKQFWINLLLRTDARKSVADTEATQQIGALRSEQDILAAVAAVDPNKDLAKASALRDAAVRRLAEPDMIEKASKHVLQEFETLVESNPRAMKRQVMAYGMARASDLASFRNTPQTVLAAWSILSLRWPVLAGWLQENPDRISYATADEAGDINVADAERPLLSLMRSDDVGALLSRFDAAALRSLSGKTSPEVRVPAHDK